MTRPRTANGSAPATLIDCGGWARLVINHDYCYSDQPCALRRICYGDASTWVRL